MAQINFYVTKVDEANLLEYIRSRGGYLARDIPGRGITEIVTDATFENIPKTSLHILDGKAFPVQNLNDKRWRTRVKRGIFKWTNEFAGPSICYQLHDNGDEHITCARLWCQYGALSFHGTGPWKGGPPLDFPERYASNVKAFDNLYKGISNFIRKNYRRESDTPGAFWHGPDSDILEAKGTSKYQLF